MEETFPVWVYKPDREHSCCFMNIEEVLDQIRMDIQDGGWMDRDNAKTITITPQFLTRKEIDAMEEFPGW